MKNQNNRIMIFGLAGSGKSTFAVKLGDLTGLPVIHLDRYFFVNNWIERDYDEFLQIQQNFVDQEEWIIDGNSVRSLEMRYARAHVVLYFRFNRFFCIWRLFKRYWHRDPRILDRAPDCKEQVTYKLLKYMWNFDKAVSPKIADYKAEYPHVKFCEINSQHDLDVFLGKFV